MQAPRPGCLSRAPQGGLGGLRALAGAAGPPALRGCPPAGLTPAPSRWLFRCKRPKSQKLKSTRRGRTTGRRRSGRPCCTSSSTTSTRSAPSTSSPSRCAPRPAPRASGAATGWGRGGGGGQGAGVPPAREERGPSPASLPRSLCGPSQAFNVVFENAIQKTAPADEVRQRVMNLTDEITYSVYMYTARGLFERDKLIFLAQVAFQVTRPGRQPPRPEPVGWGAAASGRGAPRGVSERSGPRQGDGPTATE